jgi:hypothetical protein
VPEDPLKKTKEIWIILEEIKKKDSAFDAILFL